MCLLKNLFLSFCSVFSVFRFALFICYCFIENIVELIKFQCRIHTPSNRQPQA